jgi:hypothetical protein
MSYVYFKTKGYIPTDLSNWQKKHIGIHDEYGVYLNEDPGIAECHIAAYKRCGQYKLKEMYEKQGKPYYYTCATYPNAPFIVFKQKKENEERLKVRNDY